MNRLVGMIALVLFCSAGILSLIWFGNDFASYTASRQKLRVNKPVNQDLTLGTPVAFELKGSGFNKDTSVSLFMDIHNSDAVVNSFPLDGIFNHSFLRGDYLYLAPVAGGIQVLNIANPEQPFLVNEYLIGRTINGIHLSGDTIYFCCGKLGIAIMHIQKDGCLNHVGDIATDSIARKCVHVDGYLYVAAGSSGLLIYDVRQPEKILLPQRFKAGTFLARMDVDGHHLYLAGEDNVVEIYQITDPQRPLLVDTLPLSGTLYEFVVHKNQLFIGTEAGISLYDIKNSPRPRLIHHWTDLGSSRRITVGSDRLFVSDNFSGLRIIDPSRKESPKYFDLNIDPRTISESNSHLFVAGSNKGLLVVDKKQLTSRQVVNTYNTPRSARDLFIRDQWMYVADGRGGVQLLNLDEDSGDLLTVSSGWGESFCANQDILFIAQAKEGISGVNISDPGQPKPLFIWPEFKANRMAVTGRFLLTSKGILGIDLINISDLDNPVINSHISDVHALDIVADERYVYVVTKKRGLLIYEITAKNKLSPLGQLSTPFPMNHFDLTVAIEVKEGIAYIANGRSGLLVVDVNKPAHPKILSSIAIPGISKGIKIKGSMAFMISHHGGINFVDIDDPENPYILNSLFMRGLSRGMQINDDLLFVTQKELGVTAIAIPLSFTKKKVVSGEQMEVVFPSPSFPGRYSLQVNNHRESVVVSGVVNYE